MTDCDELQDRLSKLETEKGELRDNQSFVIDRVRELQDENEQLRDRIDRLEQLVMNIDERFEGLADLAEDEQSTPKKRLIALRQGMINLAQTRAEDDRSGAVSWTYNDVIDYLEANGHGNVYATQAYRLMDDLDDLDGFGTTTKDGGDQVIRTNLDALPVDPSVNSVNNASEVLTTSEAAQTTQKSHSD